jgi:NitT/TauT family transport system permease protein
MAKDENFLAAAAAPKPGYYRLQQYILKNKGLLSTIFALAILMIIWSFAAKAIGNTILLPLFGDTAASFFNNWVDPKIMSNLWITLRRVFIGVIYSMLIGIPLGMAMGMSKAFMQALAPIINSLRQIPIMAWVPLSIIWFGLGEGPTVFLITMSAVFPLVINTIDGVRGITPDYYNAARSMGATTKDLILHITLPGALPSILTGCRMALGLGWMSVICAEFIATSSGFGLLMIEAQNMLKTEWLYSLMIMSAIVGYIIDRVFILVERGFTSWRFKNESAGN